MTFSVLKLQTHSSVGSSHTECRWCVPLDCHCGSAVYINGFGSLLLPLSLPFNTSVSGKPCCGDNHVSVMGLRGESSLGYFEINHFLQGGVF